MERGITWLNRLKILPVIERIRWCNVLTLISNYPLQINSINKHRRPRTPQLVIMLCLARSLAYGIIASNYMWNTYKRLSSVECGHLSSVTWRVRSAVTRARARADELAHCTDDHLIVQHTHIRARNVFIIVTFNPLLRCIAIILYFAFCLCNNYLYSAFCFTCGNDNLFPFIWGWPNFRRWSRLGIHDKKATKTDEEVGLQFNMETFDVVKQHCNQPTVRKRRNKENGKM